MEAPSLPASPKDYDNRILWIKSIVLDSLYYDDTVKGSKAFTDCLETKTRQALTELIQFLDKAAFPGIFFYRPLVGDQKTEAAV